MQRIFTPWRLKWYPRLFLFALGAAFIIAALSGKGASTLTGRLGGDYPAFYSAGRIIAEGNWKDLYNPEKLFAAQKDLFPGEKEGYLYFAYPPFVAIAYYPLSLLDYRLSYVLHTLLMFGVLILILQLIRPMNELVDRYYMCALFLAFSFYPIFKSIVGGQNTMITLLVIVISWQAVLTHHEWFAGAILGLLLFKPQFGLPLIGLYVLSGRWRVGMGSAFAGMILYAIGVLIGGPFWIATWFKLVSWYRQADEVVNHANSVSWLGFFEAIFGSSSQFALIIGWGMIFVTAVALSLIWGIGGKRSDLTAQLGITATGLILMAPHAMYYDMGLVLFTYLSIIRNSTIKRAFLYGLVWLSGFGQFLSVFIGFSPLFLLLIFTGFLAVRSLGQCITNPSRNNEIQACS